MNKQIFLIICLLAIIIINLAISYFIKTKEGMATQAQIYSTSSQNKMKEYGFDTGFAGSGSNVVKTDNTDYNAFYQANLPQKTQYDNTKKLDQGKFEDIIFNDVQYHDDINTIKAKEDEQYGLTSRTITVKDTSGNTFILKVPEIQGSTLYYEPGTYRFGASSYVPNYEDSVYLSKTTGISSPAPIKDTASIAAGFCKHYKNNPDKLEEICRTTEPNKCGSTSCCVLLGGSQCVSGNENGPFMKANYSDIFIRNKDFYYFQGKCYGNCK
jgi:hypothetical protein